MLCFMNWMIFLSISRNWLERKKDTAGTEKYRCLFTSYYRGAHGVFVVYDITNVNSFLDLRVCISDIIEYADPTIVKMLVGNKCDDTSNRFIATESAQTVSEEYGFSFLEVSSKTNINMDKLLYTMVSKLHKPQKQPTQNSQSTQNTIKVRSISFEEKKISSNKSKSCCQSEKYKIVLKFLPI